MKYTLSLLFIMIVSLTSFSQDFVIKVAGSEFSIDNIPTTFNAEIKKISIKKSTADTPPKTFKVQVGDEEKPFTTNGSFQEVTFTGDIRDRSISILGDDGNIAGTPFILKKPAGGGSGGSGGSGVDNGSPTVILPKMDATEYILTKLYKNQITIEPGIGLKIKARPGESTTGDQYIHLFFDQNGNSLIQSIPVGIARANYVVHVIYLAPKDNPLNIEYKANQSPADIEEGVVIRTSGSLPTDLILQGADKNAKVQEYVWNHSQVSLTPSSFDIKFDIVRSGFSASDGAVSVEPPTIIATRIIKMKRVFHGSIDVGILQTNLADPSFTLATSDVDPSKKVVKKTNDDRRIMATAMYTFYVSPIVLLEKLFKVKKVKNYKLEGRNFVDDHKIYERIYPAIGVSLSNRLLDNVFLGGKWEFSRGGAIFAGYHRGKVDVLEVDNSFKFEETYITQESFDLKTKKKWKGDFCIGLNLDLRIITNLFRGAAGNP